MHGTLRINKKRLIFLQTVIRELDRNKMTSRGLASGF